MAGPDQEKFETEPLSKRLDGYRDEVQRLVKSGVEHSRYELTRECSLLKENAKSRIGFVKLIQGLANSHIPEEKFIVVGADQKSKCFVPVPNADEFDSARIAQMLEKYLGRLPAMEVFNSVQTDDGSVFVLIVLSSTQPRPIAVKADIQDTDGTYLLREGDVWIKVGTALRRAKQDDLEQIVSRRLDAEAEDRARKRFSDFRDALQTIEKSRSSTSKHVADPGLIFGGAEELTSHVRDLIVTEDSRRFGMLMELCRDLLVESWHKLDAYSPTGVADIVDFRNQVLSHKTNHFLPASFRIVEIGLSLIKYEARIDWFERVVALVMEVFQVSDHLHRLGSVAIRSTVTHSLDDYPGPGIPAIEAAIAARVLACYAIKRKRFQYLGAVIHTTVKPHGGTPKLLQPLLFWPLRVSLAAPDGRIALCWEKRVEGAWKSYFGNQDAFTQASCQLEFLLELSSYLALGLGGEAGRNWYDEFRKDLMMEYVSDLWRYSLETTIPIAENFLVALERGTDDIFFYSVLVERGAFDRVMAGADTEKRRDFLFAYLLHLQNWQSQVCAQLGRGFGPWFTWGDKLGPEMDKFRGKKSLAKTTATS